MSTAIHHVGSGERRSGQRFPLQLGADCAFHKRRTAVTIRCAGQIQNLSAGGCCIMLKEPARIEVGMFAHLRIEWPAALQERVALLFHVSGRVLRVDGNRIAVTIRSYQFRLRGR